jgi:arginase family enzyme
VATLFGSRGGTIEELSAGDYAGMGVPFDSTASSRPGAAEGPDAVRRASRVFASYLNSLGEHEMFDTRTGEAFRYREPRLVDTGDVAVFPADIRRTFQSLALGARDVAAKGATQVAIGGDHSVSFPLFAGFQEAARRRGQEDRVGYIQVDHHFDFRTGVSRIKFAADQRIAGYGARPDRVRRSRDSDEARAIRLLA